MLITAARRVTLKHNGTGQTGQVVNQADGIVGSPKRFEDVSIATEWTLYSKFSALRVAVLTTFPLNSIFSDQLPLHYSVPQGCSAGPVKFIAYTEDVSRERTVQPKLDQSDSVLFSRQRSAIQYLSSTDGPAGDDNSVNSRVGLHVGLSPPLQRRRHQRMGVACGVGTYHFPGWSDGRYFYSTIQFVH